MTEAPQHDAQAVIDSADTILTGIESFVSLTGEIESAVNKGLASLEAHKLAITAHIESAKNRALSEIQHSKHLVAADEDPFKDRGYSSDDPDMW